MTAELGSESNFIVSTRGGAFQRFALKTPADAFER
jgi:hypothetical protein